MDSFDNFQYDSGSSYGGIGIVDDNSSVYTATTQDNSSSVDLSGLSISNGSPGNSRRSHSQHSHIESTASLDEDFDAVLDDLKDESAVDLPPHACRRASTSSNSSSYLIHLIHVVIAEFIHQHRS